MSGFGDDEKLRAARELAQSFSKSKPPKKKNVGGGNFSPRPVIYVPQHHQPMPKLRQPPVTKPAFQNVSPSVSSIPPPSMRNYSATTSFSTGRAGKSVIGTSGLDFLKASGDKARGKDIQPNHLVAGGLTSFSCYAAPTEPSLYRRRSNHYYQANRED